MDFLDLVRRRRSVRAYRDDVPPREALHRCVEAARLAPSACNAQPWHFVVVAEAERRRLVARAARLAGSAMNRFAEEAPVIVAVVAERPNLTSRIGAFLKRKPFYLLDIGIAAEHFCLQAAEEGLGTCMVGWFDEGVVRRALRVPARRRIALLITVGYAAADGASRTRRKAYAQIADWEFYGAAGDPGTPGDADATGAPGGADR